MTTAADIITQAFGKVGVRNPTAAQIASALISLNNLVSMLGPDIFPPYRTRENLTLTAGDAEYTIGSGGDLATVRPMSLESCYLRDSNGYDYPVNIVAPADYNDLYCKTLEGRPENVYFTPEYPLAKILFDYEPDEAYTAYFDFVKNLTEFAATTTSVSLPNEHKEMLVYNLAVSLGEDWDRTVSRTVIARAQETRDIIERMQAANRPCAKATFDWTGSRYNIYTDR